MVDVLISDPVADRIHTVRIANTHLESLPQGGHARPEQLAAIGQILREAGVGAGLVGGDMNMISQSDMHIHTDAGLCDAYNGPESAQGHTWGYQPPRQYPPRRLDRIFYVDNASCRIRVDHPERIGVGLQTVHGLWLSDHYGLLTRIGVESV